MTESASEGVTGLATATLQSESLVSDLPTAAAQVFGLSLVAGGLAAVVAVAYRWYVNERVPSGLPILVGLSGVALYLGTSRALSQVIGNTGDPLDATAALANIVTFLVALAAARAGMDVGDRVGVDVFVAAGATEVESEVSRVVQAVGRVITVELPDEIDDIVGYDPVPDETKSKLGGKTFVFPRRLTVAELRDRLVTRLKADYAVGHVDIELGADGTVDFLALGARAAGIGPTLPPETSAVAVRADPAFAASAGDLVQVWRRDPFERVLTAEVRATSDDVVTLAVDAADTRKLDDGERYKLVTLPVETRPDREFVSLLRAAEETMAAVTVGERSALDGQPAGALDVSVVAIRPATGPVEPLPGRDRRLRAGDSLYLVATPEAIRKVEAAATAPTDRPAAPAGGAELAPEERLHADRAVAGDSPTAASGGPESAVDESAGDASGNGSRGAADQSPTTRTTAAPRTESGRSSTPAGDDGDATAGDREEPGSSASTASHATENEAVTADENEGSTDGESESEATAGTLDGGDDTGSDDATATLGDPDLVDLDDSDGSDGESDADGSDEAADAENNADDGEAADGEAADGDDPGADDARRGEHD